MSSLPDAKPSGTPSSRPHHLLTFLLHAARVRAASFAAWRALQDVGLPASTTREFSVGHQPVKSPDALDPVPCRHFQRGADRHEPKVQFHPDIRIDSIRISVQTPENALDSEQLSRQLVAGGLRDGLLSWTRALIRPGGLRLCH
jgi:hypothetical protein